MRNKTMHCAGILAAAVCLCAGPAFAAGAGDAAEGELVFQSTCGICHSAEQGAAHKIGPNLFGVIGATSGMAEGYPYSDAMAAAGITWSAETLSTYLAGPAQMVPGTKMAFPGFSNPEDETNLIAYLETLN